MAASATATEELDPAAAVDKTSKPPSDIVLPPKDIRTIVEKTAGYVARNGVAFEDRIRQKEASNPKFSFLSTNDAYYPFYQWRLDEIRAGRGTTVSAGPLGPGPAAAAAAPEEPKGPEAPPEFHFSARMPIINAQDLDVLKLTARFVAKNGRSWMTTLSQKEANNPQFDFLRPQHRLNQFFSRLIDQFSELLVGEGEAEEDNNKVEQARLAEVAKDKRDKFRILERAKQRAEYAKYQEKQKQQKEDEAEAEKVAYAEIDWHDFVVVETVVFTDADDEADLPPPTSLSDLQSASLEQKAMNSLQPANRRIEEAMPTADEPDAPVAYPQQPQYPAYPPPPQQPAPPSLPHHPSQAPPPPPPPTATHSPQPPYPPTEPPRPTSTEPANARSSTNASGIKIRSDYVPRAQAQRGRQTAGNTAICPNCKQPIPYDELAEHMRYELLDPTWKEQRAKADSRHATTNLSTADVANNLKRLASQRTDVFDGVTGEPISEEEAARRKKAATSYDGIIQGVNDGSVAPGQASAGRAALQQQARAQQMQSININEQLEHIRQKAMNNPPSSSS